MPTPHRHNTTSGKAVVAVLLLLVGLLLGMALGALVVPRLMPKVPMDSKLRRLPVIGGVFPVDLATVKPPPAERLIDPEMNDMLSELRKEQGKWEERAKNAEAREKALRDHEQAVMAAQRKALEMRKQAEQEFQQKFKELAIEIKAAEQKNLKQLAKIYAQMKPDDAATIVKVLEDETVVKILSLMKERQAGMILSAYARMDQASAVRAAEISEKMRKVITRTLASKTRK